MVEKDQSNDAGKTDGQQDACAECGWQAQAHAANRGAVNQRKEKNRDDRNERPAVAEGQVPGPERLFHEDVGDNQLKPYEISPIA